MKKRFIVMALVTIALLIFAGCSAAAPLKDYSRDEAPSATTAATAAPAAPAEDAEGGTGQITTNTNKAALTLQANAALPVADQKLIRTGKIELRTKTYDADFDKITSRIGNLGGYIERSNESGTKPTQDNPNGRSANILARVPKASFDPFLSELGKIGEMVSRNVDSQDISGVYSDTENKLKTLRIKLERLQSFLSSATKPQDILDFETQISETEQQIDALSGDLQRYDNQVDYSAIEITLREVVELQKIEPTKKTDDFGTNISNSFYGGLNAIKIFFEAIGIALAASWPFLLLIGAIVFVTIWFATAKSRRAKKKAKETAPTEAEDHNPKI